MRAVTAAGLAVLFAVLGIACDGNGTQTIESTPEQDRSEPQATGAAIDLTRGLDDDELARRASLFNRAEFRASYVMTGDFAGSSFQGTLTWYQKPGMARGDFVGQVGGREIDIVIIPGPGYPSEEFLYFCRRQDRSCIEAVPESEQNPYPEEAGIIVFASLLIGAEEFAESVIVTDTSSRTIAGQQAKCFEGQETSNGDFFGAGEVCATADGITLAMTIAATDQTISLEATEFSRDVSDDVFDLPYPLTE